MSEYWDIGCKTCAVEAGAFHANHGADRIAVFVPLLPAIAQLGEIDVQVKASWAEWMAWPALTVGVFCRRRPMSITVGGAIILRAGKVCPEAIAKLSTEQLKHFLVFHAQVPHLEAQVGTEEVLEAIRAELASRGLP